MNKNLHYIRQEFYWKALIISPDERLMIMCYSTINI